MHHLQHIAQLAPLLKAHGLRQVVIAPGSRNAPLIQLFTADKDFSCHSIVDERSAGYVALGMARELKEAVGVVTTSGTAVLNLLPAVAEARHQGIPLIVITGDRPPEVLPQFDNQITTQALPFLAHVKASLDLREAVETEDQLEKLQQEMDALLKQGLNFPPGPVHMNFLLHEPLYVELPDPRVYAIPAGEDPLKDDIPVPAPVQEKLMILVGMGSYDQELGKVLLKLTKHTSSLVVAENLSNLRDAAFIAYPELTLAMVPAGELEELRPDRVLALGKQVVSKGLKLLLQDLPPERISDLSDIENPATLLESLVPDSKAIRNKYAESWKKQETKALAGAATYLESAEFGSFSALHHIVKDLPAEAVLHLGNSSTIRFSQLMPGPEKFRCYSNRGTSGIDGCLSSAVGAAMVSDSQHVIVLGDLSLAYDSNGLWNRNFPENLRVIVLNDKGGGIFRLLDGPSQMPFFEAFSVSHHPVNFESLAEAFGRTCIRVDNPGDLQDHLPGFFKRETGAGLLEIDTSACENSRIFKDLFN